MAILIEELNDSRSIGYERGERRYRVTGTNDSEAARSGVWADAPIYFGGLIKQDARVDVTASYAGGIGHFVVVVPYAKRRPPIEGSITEAFETSGGSQRITQALAATAYGPGAIEDEKLIIGWDGETVQGIDVIVPQWDFSLRCELDPADVTEAYKATISLLTGRVNNAAWRGFAAGTLLFRGATGPGYTEDDPLYEIAYNFSASPNRTGLSVGGITGIAKDGWEHMDIRYANDEDGTRIIAKPIAVYVQQIYETGNFGDIILESV